MVQGWEGRGGGMGWRDGRDGVEGWEGWGAGMG